MRTIMLLCFGLIGGGLYGNERPNIIYILADDLGYGDLGVYGQSHFETPRLDQMANEGIRFTQHYAGSTVCGPSRCSLITGKHTGRAYIRSNSNRKPDDVDVGGDTPLPAEEITLAEVLKPAGYTTAAIGKWGLGSVESTGFPTRQGFDFFLGYADHIRAHNAYIDYVWKNEDKLYLGNVIEVIDFSYAKGIGSVTRDKIVHTQDVFTEEALTFISNNQEGPFFLYLAYTLPHANNEGPRMNAIGMETPEDLYEDRPWSEVQKAMASSITYLDRDIGKILDHLEALGIAEHTLVMFSSDNGPHAEGGVDPTIFDANGPLRGIKRDLYEGGVRVPMIAYWPGSIKPGSETGHLSAFWDVMPTLADLAGVETPEESTGISFLPTLLGETKRQEAHNYLYWEFPVERFGGYQAVRSGPWKLVRRNTMLPGTPVNELYHLGRDLGESAVLNQVYREEVNRLLKYAREAHQPSDLYPLFYEAATDE